MENRSLKFINKYNLIFSQPKIIEKNLINYLRKAYNIEITTYLISNMFIL